MARFIGSRKDLTEDKLEEIEELVMDTTKAQAIFEAARVSMGEQIDSTRDQFCKDIEAKKKKKKRLWSQCSFNYLMSIPYLACVISIIPFACHRLPL